MHLCALCPQYHFNDSLRMAASLLGVSLHLNVSLLRTPLRILIYQLIQSTSNSPSKAIYVSSQHIYLRIYHLALRIQRDVFVEEQPCIRLQAAGDVSSLESLRIFAAPHLTRIYMAINRPFPL